MELSKLAIELLTDAEQNDDVVFYEDFLSFVESAPKTSEGRHLCDDDVINAAEFIVQQVRSCLQELGSSVKFCKMEFESTCTNATELWSVGKMNPHLSINFR